MCCPMSLVCPSFATHSTCQFWARSEPVNTPKTIEFPAKCGVHAVIRFLYSEKATRNVVLRCCPPSWQILGRTLQLLRSDSCSVFDLHHPPRPVSLLFSSLSWYETVVGGQHFGSMTCRPASELAGSIGGWLLWRGYWKVDTTLRKMSTPERRLCTEVVGKKVKVKVNLSPLQAMEAHGGCGCKGPHIHSHGTRMRLDG